MKRPDAIYGKVAANWQKRRTGTQFTHIAYKGGGQAVIDVLAGQIPLLATAIPTVQAHIKSGKLKGIALTSAKRHASLPDVGTFAEAGLTGFDIAAWYGLLAPAGTPPAIIEKIQREVVRIYSDPEVASRLDKAGITPVTTTPAEFDTFFRKEAERWAQVFKDSGLKLD